MSESENAPLLSIRGLTKTFRQKSGLFSRQIHEVHALDDVSLDIPRGATIGVVGESGSGKSTLGRCILRLTDPDRGTVTWFDPGSAVLQPAHVRSQRSEVREQTEPLGYRSDRPTSDLRPPLSVPAHHATADDESAINITALSGEDLRIFRRRMQVIFQDPFNSLNPARPVWQVVGEGLFVAGTQSAAAIRERAAVMLESVGLNRDHLDRLPHEFSGGQRQRIAIARALIVEPEFIVCDEVTSALDTRTQAQVLDLLRALQARTGVTLLFISHDLHTVAAMSREVVVMHRGRIIERGGSDQLFTAPTEPYTRALVAAVPHPDPRRRTFRRPIAPA